MNKSLVRRLAPILPIVLVLPAWPALADDAEIKALRDELQQLRQSYEQRLDGLEKRLAAAERRAGQAEDKAVEAQAAASQRQASEAAFNPGISLILGGTYTRLSRSPNEYHVGGFVPATGEVAPPPRSFALGESELGIAANIDPWFRGQLTAAIAPEGGIDVEEGYIQTLALAQGANLKAGRFLSGIGYLNEQHAHAWDFADAPLAYKAFFGGQLKNDGVQLRWLAPTETYLEVGAEAARGGPFPSTDRDKNGTTLGAAYVHVGGDVGDSNSWRAGLSFIDASPRDRSFTDPIDGSVNAFSGRSRTAVADFIWKWAPHGNSTTNNFKLQGEYLQRREDGELNAAAYASRQSGWYLQGVYQFMPLWRVGLRLDRLDYGSVTSAAALPAILEPYSPRRISLMTDWSPSEFSRIRLQWARDEARPGEPDNQVWLQYVMSLGVHGAHKF